MARTARFLACGIFLVVAERGGAGPAAEQRPAQAALGDGGRGVAGRRPRRLRRREQRRHRPALRAALGDDARRRQERPVRRGQGAVRQPGVVAGRPVDRLSRHASATRPDSSSRAPTARGARFVAEMSGTNAPLPGSGRTVAWSPDGKRIAFVSSVPGPETADATGDPMVITRYLYKPDAAEGMTRFNDNRRLHLFVADVSSGRIEQLTDGNYYEHSIDWSANGRTAVPLEPRRRRRRVLQLRPVRDEDGRQVDPPAERDREQRIPSRAGRPTARLIAFEATKRGLTDRETTMEDTHVWVMNADGTNRREVGTIDNRQGRARVDRRRQRAAVHRAGARAGAAVSRAGRPAASRRSS